MSDADAISRANRAFYELEEVAAAFEALKAAIITTLAETPVGQDAKVLKLHMSLQNLSAVRKALQNTYDNGLVAGHTRAAADAMAVHGLTRP